MTKKSMFTTFLCLSWVFLLGLSVSCASTNENEQDEEITDSLIMSFDGNKINYIEHGKNDTAIIFVHGWSGEISNWDNQIPGFKTPYRIIAVDLVGFGKSERNRQNWTMESFGKDILETIKSRGVKKAFLVGHSMGGFSILEAAVKNPDKIIGIIPVDVFHNPEEKSTNEKIEERIKGTLNYLTEQNTEIRQGWEDALREALNWKNDRLTDLLSKIDIPIICINSDRYEIRMDIANKYNSKMSYKIVEGAGHGVMIEAPDRFNVLLKEAIDEFLLISR